MIWLLDRGGEQLRFEICRDDDGPGYLLVMTKADGGKRVEHVEQPTELIERSLDQLRQLKDEGWKIG
jgi:hypothetical protein